MQTKWFDREFDFSFDETAYKNIRQRLQDTPAILETITAKLPVALLELKPEGKWSIKEHIGHLSVLESLWRTRIHDILQYKPVLAPADLDNKATTEAGFNNYTIITLLEGFAKERSPTLTLLDSIDVVHTNQSSLHPRLKQPMRIIDHLYFVAEHDEHHIAVIKEIMAQ